MTEQEYYFEKAFRQHHENLCRFADYKYVKDLQTAKDIVQEMFIGALVKKVDFSMKRIRSYLYEAVKNDCIDHLRKAKTEKSNVTQYQWDNSAPESDGAEVEEERLLFEFIDQLPLVQQQTLHGFLKGETIKQLAQERDVSKQTVKNNRQLAVIALRKMFRKAGKKTSPRRKKT